MTINAKTGDGGSVVAEILDRNDNAPGGASLVTNAFPSRAMRRGTPCGGARTRSLKEQIAGDKKFRFVLKGR